MIKARIYIVQFLGILALLCGYFLSDPPDSLSVMHFNPDPDCPSVFSKAVKSIPGSALNLVSVSGQGSTNHKSNIPKYISFELMLTAQSMIRIAQPVALKHTASLPRNYEYLYFKEVNPPPPRA